MLPQRPTASDNDDAETPAVPPLADDPTALAADWLVRRGGEDWTVLDEAALARWRAERPLHDAAFARAERVWAELAGLKQSPELLVSGSAAVPAPAWAAPRRPVRRARLWQGGGLALMAVAALFLVTRGDPVLAWQADQRTAINESRDVTLPDGSQVRLFADSAIAIDYSPTERRVALLRGEALFEALPIGTVHDGAPERRPFVVQAATGTTRALGTRFIVERQATHTRVVGVEHRVAVAVDAAPGVATTLSPGQVVRYDAQGVGPVESTSPQWLEAEQAGQLVFERTSLQDVVTRLNRHFSGHIALRGGAVAQREVSGVFPASDVDAALDALQAELGLRVLRLPGYVLLY